jgi:hypothetical protein
MNDLSLKFYEILRKDSRGILLMLANELGHILKFPKAMKAGMKILFIMNFIVSHSPKWPCIYIMVGVL